MKHVLQSKGVRPFVECSCGRWTGLDTETVLFKEHLEDVIEQQDIELVNLRAEVSRLTFN